MKGSGKGVGETRTQWGEECVAREKQRHDHFKKVDYEDRERGEAVESKGANLLIYFVSLHLALRRDWYSGLQEKKEKQPSYTCNDLK